MSEVRQISDAGANGSQVRPATKANEAMHPRVMSEAAFTSKLLRDAAFYADDTALVLNMDVRDGIALLAEAGVEVNCVVTSPPFYGQRDYEVDRQIGLEGHPAEFISTLADIFDFTGSILASNGSLPGAVFLATNPQPTNKEFKRHAYWNRAANDLYVEYSGICAYTSMHMVYAETIDHFKPKSKHPALAYEWDNLRLCRGRVNVSKGDNEHVLDPFEVENTWFRLELPSCLIKAAPGLPHDIKVKVNNTLNTLRLNSDDSLVQERCNILIAYARNDISQAFLAERYPFLAFQVDHQGLQEDLPAIFKLDS